MTDSVDEYVPKRGSDYDNSSKNNVLSGQVYNGLKWVTLIFLPAFATLYTALGTVWDFPFVQEIVFTSTTVMTFLGTLLQISSSQFKTNPDGVLTLNTDGDYPTLRVQMPELPDKDMVVFRVDTQK